jgi:hypothetical protein
MVRLLLCGPRENERERHVLDDVEGREEAGAWKTMAIGPGRSDVRPPRAGQRIKPVVGTSSPAIMCNSVDFPDPEGPTSAMRSPGQILQLASWTATTAFAPDP